MPVLVIVGFCFVFNLFVLLLLLFCAKLLFMLFCLFVWVLLVFCLLCVSFSGPPNCSKHDLVNKLTAFTIGDKIITHHILKRNKKRGCITVITLLVSSRNTPHSKKLKSVSVSVIFRS